VQPSPSPPAQIDALVDRALARLPDFVSADAMLLAKLRRVAVASDFAIEVLARQPDLLATLAADDGAAPVAPPDLVPGQGEEWPRLLRRYRRAESTRLVWRDVLGLDDVDATLAGTTRLAESCLQLALAALEVQFEDRHGLVRAEGGADSEEPVRLVVFALGKLGGGELNFSSDIDLVYAYEHGGTSDGPRPLAAEDYFARQGQALARLLDETTADGFCHRVDLRLRPYGNAGRVALSFSAMEQYFQREGRDWERYAWQKARPVAGDGRAGQRLLDTLRPFVYRRYIDYGALDGLREMKATIAAEVARKELADDIKRGPGGIREIEFLAQALQLIRGGREPVLRERRLVPALRALEHARQVEPAAADALVDAYRFLRRLENRLQMLRDAQTHVLPEDAVDRARVALALDWADWDALRTALDTHRARVSEEFGALLAARAGHARASGDLSGYWRALPDGGDAQALADAGYGDATGVDSALRDFVRAPGVRDLSDASRARLDRVMPVLLQATATSTEPVLALRRLLALLHNILRRASYLALLDEEPPALARLVDVVTRSALLAERLAAHPLLLDELLDARAEGPLPERALFAAACSRCLEHEDLESALYALNELRQTLSFRIALATLDGRQSPQASTRQLAWLADAVVDVARALAVREMRAAHGVVAGARFAVLGYGSLGGEELGFGSDLDLVFLYDAEGEAPSDGARPLDASRWFARLAQKIVALLGTVTGAGRLFDVDVRLRPDGAQGLLVSTLSSYAEYQRERAWTWEHQALVRARCASGDASLCAEFEAIRAEVLARGREADTLREDVVGMRARMRSELDRSTAIRFDLKQGEGGLVDLEFLVQYLVLRDASAAPALMVPRATPLQLDALRASGAFDAGRADALAGAHATLLAAALSCSLDRRRRWVQEDAAIAASRDAIREAVRACGLDFGAASPA
jgi:[glutamine synthetase] adenylyltransferase / [glutamine synthetase]-adenylyl-L-tyrosine phosphorylase